MEIWSGHVTYKKGQDGELFRSHNLQAQQFPCHLRVLLRECLFGFRCRGELVAHTVSCSSQKERDDVDGYSICVEERAVSDRVGEAEPGIGGHWFRMLLPPMLRLVGQTLTTVDVDGQFSTGWFAHFGWDWVVIRGAVCFSVCGSFVRESVTDDCSFKPYPLVLLCFILQLCSLDTRTAALFDDTDCQIYIERRSRIPAVPLRKDDNVVVPRYQ